MLRLVVFSCVILAAYPVRSEEFSSDPSHITSLSQVEALEGQGLSAAEAASARALMALALDEIKDFEKWVPHYYNDASNYCTIGYGHLMARSSCGSLSATQLKYPQPISLEEGLKLLDLDTGTARLSIQTHVTQPLNDEQFGALSSFVFNVGAAGFAGSTLLKAINNGDYDIAAAQFGRWVVSKGTVLDGLVTRRQCEAALFKGTLKYRSNGKFYREDCSALGAAPVTEALVDISTGESH